MKTLLFSIVCLQALGMAQSAPSPVPDARVELAAKVESADRTGPVMHGSLGSDFTSAYFFRGIQQENQGAIGEPYLELAMPVYEGEGTVRSLDLTLGQWNSLHDGPTGSGGPQSMWYENDLYVGLTAHMDERWSAGAVYTAYYSPNGRFGTVQEIAFALDYDDRDQLGTSFPALQPSLLVAFETSGQADATGKSGTYAELGVAPSWSLGSVGELEVSLTVPVKVGLSLGHYYQSPTAGDSTLGYVDVGAVVGAPLSFLPGRMGPWAGTLGLHALFLGDSNKELNQNEETKLLVTCGLSTTF